MSVCVCVLQARMLMVEENLMTTIIRTFVDHLRHRDLQGRFQFDRYTAQQAFKFGRVQSLIGDLKLGPVTSWYTSYAIYTPITILTCVKCVCAQVRPHQLSLWVERSAPTQVSRRSRRFSRAAQVYAGNTPGDTHLNLNLNNLSVSLWPCLCLNLSV